jgi:hypothetical protein
MAATVALRMYLGPSFGGDKAAGETAGPLARSILSLELNATNCTRNIRTQIKWLRQSDTI